MANEFDLGLNIASIETELPDPVITLTGSDNLTASETAEMPLLALTAYGRSTQGYASYGGEPFPIENIGDGGSLTLTTCGKNLFMYIDYTAVPINPNSNGKITKTADEITIVTTDAASSGALIPPSAVSKMLGNFDGCKITFSCDIYSDSEISLSMGLSDAAKVKLSAGAWKRYSVVNTVDLTRGLRFYNKSGVVAALNIRNIQIELGETSTDYEPYKSTTAKIVTALPLRGIPVSSGGNYTDSNGQEWVCDTLEHIYGEPAQYVQRVEKSKAVIVDEYNLREHGAAVLTRWRDDSNTEPLLTYYEKYLGEYGIFSVDDLDGHRHCKLYGIDKYELRRPPYYPNPYIGGYQYSQFGWDIDSPNYEGLEFVLLGDWRYEDGSPYEGARPGFALENGKDIPKEYICTTGVVTAGAEIIYPEKENITLLTTAETEELNSLSGFTGSTTIYNDSTAEMTVKLLREDFEMQYIHWIKESQSYVCEKAGKYKIICVGGGSSGGIGATGTAEIMQAAGTTTSFGTIISAEGGGKSRALVGSMHIGSGALVGGQSGYDGINYGSTSHVMTYESTVHFSSTGSNSSVMWGTGHGYGAGGGARSYSDVLLAAGGRCGKVESTIVDLEENQTIACTIGGGGVLKLSDANVLDYLKTYVDKETTSASGMGEKVSACVSDGADGVIIIQYLGV